MSNATRPRWRRALRVILILVSTLAALELVAFVGVSLSQRRIVGARTLFRAAMPRRYEGCGWGDGVSPHPYLAYHYHHDPDGCNHALINTVGLQGPEIPWHHEPQYFTVLVIGGSVAEQFAGFPNPPQLERVLNRDYLSPTGRPWRVLNAGLAGSNHPVEGIAFLLFHEVADAVVSIEGFNEHHRFGSTDRLESAPYVWQQLTALRGGGYRSLLWLRLAQDLFEELQDRPILSHSYTAFVTASALLHWAQRRAGRALAPAPITPPLPHDLTPEELRQFFVDQYAKYLGAIQAVAERRGMPVAFFLQPAPALHKQLTAEERSVAGDLSYAPKYRELTDRLLALRSHGLAIFSLLNAFEDHPETIYIDQIHVRPEGEGNRILAEAMVRQLEQSWHLRRKSAPPN